MDREVALTTRAYLPGGGFAAAVFETTGGIQPAAIGGWRLAADAIGEQDR